MIKTSKELVNQAVEQLIRYQSGVDKPAKTRFNHFNENTFGGIFKQTITLLVGISGTGKSFVLQQIEEDFLNKEINPDADDYILLRVNWEMTVLKMLLRKLKRRLNKTFRELLFNKVVNEDINKFREVANSERKNNIYYLDKPLTPEKWFEEVDKFLEEHRDKNHILVTIDHMGLVRDNGNKTKAMGDLAEYVNELKLKYTNVSFILIGQLNRNIESRTDLRFLPPLKSDIYNSDVLYQLSDVVLALHNPYRLRHEKYMVFPPKRYKWLTQFMLEPNNKHTNFFTENVIFWHYLKLREMDDPTETRDLYIEPMNMLKWKEYVKRKEEEKEVVGDIINNNDEFDYDDVPF